jgi:dihydrodipicolinate synthase/N-acetylneuraminate lyase
VIRGTLAAALTPLRAGGAALDEAAIDPYVEFLAAAELDGVLALGTTGEGILLNEDERRRAARAFVEAAGERLGVIVHCGAQTTAETVVLAAHAAELGADGVAVIGPPYFALDHEALFAHFAAAGHACEPLPFYLYEFQARSGYALALSLVERLREELPNLAGLKVSDRPWDVVAPYLLDGLDVFVGAEELVAEGLANGAAGAVSGLAAVYPEAVVELVRERSPEAHERAVVLRRGLERFPFHAAAKLALRSRGIRIDPHVRPPLRQLGAAELEELRRWLESS